jgi:post-segregation antitoxin (ccd killing protein)
VRTTHTGVLSVLAMCRDCPWQSEARNALGNAARHADAHGHMVVTEQSTVVIYNKREAQEVGQNS